MQTERLHTALIVPKSGLTLSLLNTFLLNAVKVPSLTEFPDRHARRLKAMILLYQKGAQVECGIEAVIDVAYNYHVHTRSCFRMSHDKRTGKSNTLKRSPQDANQYNECRYRLPNRKRRKTIVQNASDTPCMWFLWDGTSEEIYIKEIRVK